MARARCLSCLTCRPSVKQQGGARSWRLSTMPELEVLDVQKEQTAVYLISLSLYIYIYADRLCILVCWQCLSKDIVAPPQWWFLPYMSLCMCVFPTHGFQMVSACFCYRSILFPPKFYLICGTHQFWENMFQRFSTTKHNYISRVF